MESKNGSEFSLTQVPFLADIEDGKGILLAGCGGGYDIYCGIPLYFALKKMGKRVHLANLTFADFHNVDRNTSKLISKDCLEITASSKYRTHDDYFPEFYLSQWFRAECKEEVPVYMINRTAPVPVLAAYKDLVKYLDVDTVVLVDGGTDSLMRGDEEKLGSPHEDMTSIAAVDELDVRKKYLVLIGFGIDDFHGVSHKLFLENVSNLIREGGFLGTFSVMKEMKEAQLYMSACDHAFSKMQTSIVSGSIKAAIEGHYGNHQFTKRTTGSELWINPLMSMYWCFRLKQVAKAAISLSSIKPVVNYHELSNAIYNSDARKLTKIRKNQNIPL